MFEALVQKYGKQFVKELIDLMIINNNIRKDIRPWLIQHKIIKRSTKTIIYSMDSYNNYGKLENGTYGRLPYLTHYITIRNGRNQNILYFTFTEPDLPQMIEVLNSEEETTN